MAQGCPCKWWLKGALGKWWLKGALGKWWLKGALVSGGSRRHNVSATQSCTHTCMTSYQLSRCIVLAPLPPTPPLPQVYRTSTPPTHSPLPQVYCTSTPPTPAGVSDRNILPSNYCAIVCTRTHNIKDNFLF